MLNFIILDDDATHNINTSKRLQLIFKKYDMEANIVLQTTKPDEVMEYSLSNNITHKTFSQPAWERTPVPGAYTGHERFRRPHAGHRRP